MIKKEIHVPIVFSMRQLYELVHIAETSGTPLYIEKSGRIVCANKLIGLLSLQIQPSDRISILDFTEQNQKNVNNIALIFEGVSQ